MPDRTETPQENGTPEAAGAGNGPAVFETVFAAVYFPPDETVPFDDWLPVLDGAGELLFENSSLRAILRGYSAPAKSESGQRAVSRARAEYCRDYLLQNFGISVERMEIEYYGSEKTPLEADGNWETRRCVDLTVYLPQ